MPQIDLLDNTKIKQIDQFFNKQLNNKYSRKASNLESSVLKTSRLDVNHPEKKMVTMEEHIGSGSYGKVKRGRDIQTKQPIVIKIQYANTPKKHFYEALILSRLGLLHSVTTRTYPKSFFDTIASSSNFLSKLFNTQQGWRNKSKPEDVTVYNFKSYIVSKHFEGIPLSDYLEQNKSKITFKEILIILLKIFEELSILHDTYNVIHGDLSFKNILINKDSNNNIIIHIIDYGCSAELIDNEKFKIYRIQFSEHVKYNYTAPECDYRVVEQLLDFPKTELYLYFGEALEQISSWTKNHHGFFTKESDLYNLGWCINFYINMFPNITNDNKVFLEQLNKSMCEFYFYNRPPLKTLIDKCLEQLQRIEHQEKLPYQKTKSTPISIPRV